MRRFATGARERLSQMSTACDDPDYETDFGWRQSAPLARRLAIGLYSWQDPGWSFLWCVFAAAPFLIAAIFAPALLSLSPTVDMITPIAEARTVGAGETNLIDHEAPLFLLLLMAGDFFVDAPGRIHLLAKAVGALLIVYPMAYLVSSRFPVFQAAMLTAGLAAYAAAPFSGPAEIGLAMLLVCATAFMSESADSSAKRARTEGYIAGGVLFMLWLLSPVFSLAGFVLLSACPFLAGRGGLTRYAATLAAFAVLAAIAEYLAPGLNLARAAAASGIFSTPADLSGHDGAMGLSGVAFSTIMVLTSAAIFGGREHVKNWVAASVLAVVAFAAARITGANVMPVFIVAAGLACFSVASPFYDGLFRNHDRASVSAALIAASLSFFWAVALIIHAAGQFSLQSQVAKAAPENIRTELALVQPGGPTIARWVEEGRFSTPEAREFFALAPVDQSEMLLEAASRARIITKEGVDVAILTGADTACVLAAQRKCYVNGEAAASAANVVFVPRLDLDPATAAAKASAEVLLYTEFKLAERTALWEIWVRRGSPIPNNLLRGANTSLYR